MKIEIHELVAEEFDEAIEWYEIQSTGLGKRFKDTVIAQLLKIQKNPEWFLKEAENIFKAYAPKFPYKILLTSDENKIVV